MRRTCIGSGVLFRGRSHSTRGSTNNYSNDSFRPSLYPRSRIMQRSRDKNGFCPRSHAEAKKRPAYANSPHMNGNNRFTELYKHAKFTSALESFANWHFRLFFGFTYVRCLFHAYSEIAISEIIARTLAMFFTDFFKNWKIWNVLPLIIIYLQSFVIKIDLLVSNMLFIILKRKAFIHSASIHISKPYVHFKFQFPF